MKDGSGVAWGDLRYAGDCSAVQDQMVDLKLGWPVGLGFGV